MSQQFQMVPIEQLRPSTTLSQTERRKYFDKAKLEDLAASIAARGVVQPIVVRPYPFSATLNYSPHERARKFEIVAGERRYMASQIAKRAEIPAVVLELDDQGVIEVQLIENLQREDVHPMQEAEGYHELVHRYGHAVEQIHDRVGKSRSYVYGRLKLLALAPAVRKAFYAGEIDQSVALLLARIPVESTQIEAFKAVTQSDWSYRDAARIIRDGYMLRLSEAMFPTADPDLAGAGPCGACPKRTGNQTELFSDVKSADVCTDIVCFQAKTRAFGQRRIELARQAGQTVIAGKDAKKIAPHGVRRGDLGGNYVQLDREEYVGGKHQKVRKVVPKDAEIALIQDPDTGAAIEVVKRSELPSASRDESNPMSAAEKKAKFEKKVRYETYLRVREHLGEASVPTIAAALFERLEHDAVKLLCKVRGFVPPVEKRQYQGEVKDYAAIGKTIGALDAAGQQLFINDCIYVRDLLFDNRVYHRKEVALIRSIEELAKAHRVDTAALRRELAPKKKPKAKASGKKKAKR